MMDGLNSPSDSASLSQIIDRVRTYDPEKEFVIVYKGRGLMGCDVVKPKGGCRRYWNEWKEREGGRVDGEKGGVIDVDGVEQEEDGEEGWR